MTLQYKNMQAWISCRSTLKIKFAGSFSSREVSLHRKSATFHEDNISHPQQNASNKRLLTNQWNSIFDIQIHTKILHFRTIYKSLHCANCFQRLSLPVKAQIFILFLIHLSFSSIHSCTSHFAILVFCCRLLLYVGCKNNKNKCCFCSKPLQVFSMSCTQSLYKCNPTLAKLKSFHL